MPRSAKEIDIDPDTYIGLSFPLKADSNNNFTMTKNSLQQSQHNLRNLRNLYQYMNCCKQASSTLV